MHPYVIGMTIVLVTVANILTCYLYLYPFVHFCSFPVQPESHDDIHIYPVQSPPFRLLALGDPQLEGDSSIPDGEDTLVKTIRSVVSDLRSGSSPSARLQELFLADIPRVLQSYRKRIDLIGNDYYLAHIYRTLHWSLKPTHVAVLGDLIGSQWVDDDEFERRGARFWHRVFRKGERVEDEVTSGIHVGSLVEERVVKDWSRRIVNVAGNHDIGYAGDITTERLERFERVFGRANWETRFSLPINHIHEGAEPVELRLIILNSLSLDVPVLSHDIQTDTYKFINDIIGASKDVEDQTTGTILLTHLPLHKEAGVCVDGPLFNFHDEEHGRSVSEQNHLSYDASKGILEGIYGMSGDSSVPNQGFGRNGIILTGHDHEGCDVYHHLPEAEDMYARRWTAEKWDARLRNSTSSRVDRTIPGIREITVRSMMGDFSGNAGLLSGWFDPASRQWRFDYSTCSLGRQHIWWAVHILDIVTLALVIYVGWNILRSTRPGANKNGEKEKTS